MKATTPGQSRSGPASIRILQKGNSTACMQWLAGVVSCPGQAYFGGRHVAVVLQSGNCIFTAL